MEINTETQSELQPTAIIYGALAKQHPKSGGFKNEKRRLKRQLFEIRDRVLLMAGKTDYLDYRNYDNEFSSNIGDIAISETISQLITNRLPAYRFDYKNWGDLSQCNENKKKSIIVAGGGYFFIDKSGNLPKRLSNDLAYINKTKSNLILFGVGLNQPEHDRFVENSYSPSTESTESISELINHASIISVRDKTTKKFIERYTSKEVKIIGDPALFLTPELTTKTKIKQPLIGINLPFHGPSTTNLLKKNLINYIALLKELQKATKCEYRYFVHYDSEHFIARLMSSKGLNVSTIHSPPQQMISHYKELDLHIGGMLHSCILAHSAGTPCISLGYDIKHFGFFELLELQKNLFSWINLEPQAVIERALELLQNPSETRNAIAHKKTELKKDVDYILDEIVKILG